MHARRADTSHVLYNAEPLFLTKRLNTGDVLTVGRMLLQFESFTPCYTSESSSDDYDDVEQLVLKKDLSDEELVRRIIELDDDSFDGKPLILHRKVVFIKILLFNCIFFLFI